MFSLWDDKVVLDVFGTKKRRTVSFGLKQEKSFEKDVFDVTFKLRSKDGSSTGYMNMFPQSALKLAYEIFGLTKGKLEEVNHGYNTKPDDKRCEIKITKGNNGYDFSLTDPKVGTMEIEFPVQEMYMLYEYLRELSFKLMTEDIMDLTEQKSSVVKNSKVMNDVIESSIDDDDIPF